MRSPRMNDERGVALAMAIFALVIIGILVAGSFFAGRLEQQSGQNTLFAAQAAEAAEYGLSDALGTTYNSASTLQAIPIGQSSAGATVNLASGISYTQSVDRLTDGLFLYRSVGNRQSAGATVATRSVGTLVRLLSANISVNAGLTALGDVLVGGTSTVSGNDATPSAWTSAGVSCPTPANVTGVRYNGTLTQKGSAVIAGYPSPSTLDTRLDSTNIFGGAKFAALKAMRTLTLTRNVSGLAADSIGTPKKCNTALESNWGAPTAPLSVCFNYFPIVYHYGDLSISGSGEGQGILLVEGNLTVQGRIDFYGPVIVTGGVDVRGTGSDDVKFYGGILAQNVTLDDSRLTGNATVNYSSCAIKRALQGSAVPTALDERSWVQLYN